MARLKEAARHSLQKISKAPTGISGLDEVTFGGLPKGRPTLITGGPGSGKSLMGMEFLVRGATQFGEPGVFVAFEEAESEIIKNSASLGFDVPGLIDEGKLLIDYVYIERSEIEETGEYDLEGLFIRLGHAIDSIGAKRVVMDTIEALFGSFSNEAVLRAELRRLFRWLKDKGVTAIITAERGESTFTRHGLEEYVSDAVIVLDHRVNDQVATRRIRVVKYRGSAHGTNEYPMLIDETGFSVLPITSLMLNHSVSRDRISSGIPRLDAMLGGKGFYRGSSVLISGTAGTGKSSMAATVTDAACARGERVLYFAYEESQPQILRNMGSIGLDLGKWVDKGLLRFHSSRPSLYGLEMHLAMMHKLANEYDPSLVIVDPITNFVAVGNMGDVKSMLVRVIDFLKMQDITVVFTSLTSPSDTLEESEVAISSLIDSWVLLRDIESNGERNKGLYILKSRGMSHSNQIREYVITDNGINLLPTYLGAAGGVLTGSARVAQEAREKEERIVRQLDIDKMERSLRIKKQALDAQIAAMRAKFEAEADEAGMEITESRMKEERLAGAATEMEASRKAEADKSTKGRRKDG